jgi:hypothetical protein
MIRFTSYNNSGLFSSYYLDNQLRNQPEWSSGEHMPVFKRIRELYLREKEFLTGGLLETQLEERFFRPVFRDLGFFFEVQEEVESAPDFPDYAFFKSRDDLDRARRGSLELYEKAIAIGEVKRWDTELNRLGRDRHNKRRNPSFQIWLYLQEVKPAWGILSNGRKWRLFRKDRLLDTFYEVDLVNILESNDIEAFRYFYYFFRRDAFIEAGDNQAFLERVLTASEEYARGIGENLKENVYRAIRIISEGFVSYPGNNLDKRKETDLRLVQENSMRLVYRLLFALFAEARGLLSHPSYQESDYSLHTIKHDIARKKDSGQAILPMGSGYWARLKDLFKLISIGSEEFGISRKMFYVPPYDGGLFEPSASKFLETKVLGDKALANAIDLLARTSARDRAAGFIDYSTLAIQHLGSIYEGLLEYRIQLAQEDMVAVGERTLLWTPYDDYSRARKSPKKFEDFASEDRASKGEIYVGTHRGERKATGSYYTPEPVVKFIVERSLGPVTREKWQNAKSTRRPLRDATLSIKVVDPAMGSGHFLVGAVEFLAAKLMEALEADVSEGFLTEQQAEEYTLDNARREVLAHCIYGVDLNGLAVELAKVSLWLMTISKDKPLSFLDHRLKRGNSLIGSRLVDLPWMPGERPKGTITQIDKASTLVDKVVELLRRLESIPDDEIDDIRKKENLFTQLQESEEYCRITFLADAHVGLWFTNPKPAKSNYARLVDLTYAGSGQSLTANPNLRWAVESAKEARERNAFHWELEFPDVFLKHESSEDGVSGFDAVIGNPPYVSFGLGRVGKLDKEEERYIRSEFPDSAEYKISTYALFMELAVKLSRDKGFQGLILPDSFLIGRYFFKIRSLILNQGLVRLVHFDKDFWESGEVGFPVIWIGRRMHKTGEFIATFVGSLEGLDEGDYTDRKLSISQAMSNRRRRIRLLRDEKTSDAISTIERTEKVLADYISLHQGIRSKVGRDKILSESPVPGDTRWKKGLVESNQVTRFHLDYRGDYIQVNPELLYSGGWDREKIEVQKILIRRTGDSIIACVDEDGYYHTNALIYGNLNDSKDPHVLRMLVGVLNSRLFTYYYRAVTSKEGRTFPQVEIDSLEELNLPILDSPALKVESLRKTNLEAYVERGQRAIAAAEINEADHQTLLEQLIILVSRMESLQKNLSSARNGFLDWLKVAARSNFGEWTGKNSIYASHVNTFESLLDVFRANEERSQLKPISRAKDLSVLKENFESMKRKTEPLVSMAQTVDDLIDLVVYRLYGLSVEQRAVVEGVNEAKTRERYNFAPVKPS